MKDHLSHWCVSSDRRVIACLVLFKACIFSQYFYLLLFINRGISLHTQQSHTFHSEATAVAQSVNRFPPLRPRKKRKVFNRHNTGTAMKRHTAPSSCSAEVASPARVSVLPAGLHRLCTLGPHGSAEHWFNNRPSQVLLFSRSVTSNSFAARGL